VVLPKRSVVGVGSGLVIVITGSIVASEETVDELQRLAIEHVHRSRLEPGCLSHSVHRDVENPLRLVFFEQWTDMDAVLTHFAVPDSGAFVAAAADLSSEPPTLELYDATLLQRR
jgi:quinol monooxygenase YgiN